MKHKTVFKNNEEEPKPFYVHTGAAGVGKKKKSNISQAKVRATFHCINCIYRQVSLSY